MKPRPRSCPLNLCSISNNFQIGSFLNVNNNSFSNEISQLISGH